MVKIVSKWHRSIKEISKENWSPLVEEEVIPFFQWDWLSALEESGSVSSKSGWQPFHLGLWSGEKLVALAPLYLKAHSYGEFVFDHSFCQLSIDLGLNYYPKLLGMSPLSPVEGYRFFFADKSEGVELTILMMQIIDEFASRNGIISCNFLYVEPTWRSVAEKAGCATWLNQTSLWVAGEQKDFSDYLATFNANQRRNIKRERKRLVDLGIRIRPVTGNSLDVQLMRLMYSFYEKHCERWGEWGSKYLSCDFFESLARPDLRDNAVLFCAFRDNCDTPLAMSLCIVNQEMLWGRYWGSNEDIDCLHFETCYYSPIQWALEKRLHGFDPGAGGSQKRRRGFVAKFSVSLHRWYERSMDTLMRAWLPQANELMLEQIDAVNADLPFRAEFPKLIK